MSQIGIQNNQTEENILTTKNDNNNLNLVENKIELKSVEFMLTPLETLIINKKMPFGYKLDTEENIIKSKEIIKKNITKKKKLENINPSKPKKIKFKAEIKESNKKYLRERKPIIKEDLNKESEIKISLIPKFQKCIEIIKSNPLSNFYYKSVNPITPCLLDIENNIIENKYSTPYDFFMDLRKIFLFYYQKFPNNLEIRQRTFTMLELCENLCKNFENIILDYNYRINYEPNQYNRNFNYYSNDYRINNGNINQIQFQNNFNVYNNNMSIEEKNALGNAIRNLNKEQLKGIIKLLSDSKISQSQSGHTKFFEFDIDKLPLKKLRELEKYVKDCLASNNKNNKNIPSISTQIQNNKTQNQKENQNNKSNNKGINNQNQPTLKSNNKDVNKNQENKVDQYAKKIKQSNKKPDKKNESSSESDSISSGSSLSN
jgi:hypothetical protein